MRGEFIIDYIGPSDEDRAHLRLLLRQLGAGTSGGWRWGEEHRADVLFIDCRTLAGQMARARANEAGVRCVLIDATPRHPSECALYRPLRAAALSDVLDTIAAARAGEAPLLQGGAAAHPAAAIIEPVPEWTFARPDCNAAGPTADDAEALFRQPGPAAASVLRLASSERLQQAGIAQSEAPTQRSLHRAGMPADPQSARSHAGPVVAPRRAAARPLRDFLDGDLLGGPSRIEADGMPTLVLDPKERVFHAGVGLAELAPWLQREVDPGAWQALTSAQLRAVREREPPRSYLQLHWLERLQAADGRLPRHLDPGGCYRLCLPFDVEAGFPVQRRIAHALAHPIRLHELAAVAGAPMAEVFDAIAAFDAIGRIECRPRERLRAPAVPAAPAGLFARAVSGLVRSRVARHGL
jgi:hypothetical protein